MVIKVICRFVLVVLLAIGLVASMGSHGKMKREDSSYTFIAVIVQLLLLWGGGFFGSLL